jgi:hypothetical protein
MEKNSLRGGGFSPAYPPQKRNKKRNLKIKKELDPNFCRKCQRYHFHLYCRVVLNRLKSLLKRCLEQEQYHAGTSIGFYHWR